MRLLVTGGAGFIGANFVHYTVERLPQHEVVVLDDGFSWQGTRCNSLSAIARKITGTAWSGPLFFGLKQNRSAGRRSSQGSLPVCGLMEGSDAAG